MCTIFLAGPGGNWIGFLIPLVLLVVLLKGADILFQKFIAWRADRKDRNKNIVRRKVNT